uniref:DUF3531 domain-containing protein n=1 Tax=Paulinella longichromatophora TaxID=1708747 RepID=A0A2H4ZQ92_9EUKA|nr:hypothetical protein PLO_702 [Paulinella longichromatophora]
MEVRFRDFNPYNCWIWMRFAKPAQTAEIDYINTLLDSWFILGRMGAFNAQNLQVHIQGYDLSWMDYENNISEDSMESIMNAMSQPEFNGNWARCWIDLGGSDNIALDLLINTLLHVDINVVEIIELVIGGVNDDWPVEDYPEDLLTLPL